MGTVGVVVAEVLTETDLENDWVWVVVRVRGALPLNDRVGVGLKDGLGEGLSLRVGVGMQVRVGLRLMVTEGEELGEPLREQDGV